MRGGLQSRTENAGQPHECPPWWGDRSGTGDPTLATVVGQDDHVTRDPLWRESAMRLRRVTVRGPSTSPALSDGDVVLVRFGAPVRPGDVVLVTWESRPGQLSVKRAVHPDGDGWHVRGDNPFGSTDSTTLGPASVHAVARYRLCPRPGRIPAPRR
ncbi:S24/S26 family peptidase [Pseudonocardia sp. Ae505_Ps2]|uniref:S24/S26 family peptidase n=1 Tax=Pseudonocardia sp. Ae505_Ps2 TaxID=1885034 RepID=UPI0024B39C26|nr:S24/S26 family peptidase [Pseudonocardia sp. Ae505_Ps2]